MEKIHAPNGVLLLFISHLRLLPLTTTMLCTNEICVQHFFAFTLIRLPLLFFLLLYYMPFRWQQILSFRVP